MNKFNTSLGYFFNSYRFTFFLLIALAIIIHLPQHDFWPLIVQGDLGRELYVFHRTQLGDLPYKDYFYNYGPVMPFYYAVFNIIFGVKLTSVLYGVILLDVAAGMLIYFILIRWTTPVIALLGASWFWLFYEKIIFNFNHIGAVPLILLNVYLLIRFYDFPKASTFIGMVITILLLFLIKMNIGACALASSFLIITIIWLKGGLKAFPIKWPLLWFLMMPVSLAALIYYCLLQGLPFYYVKQCFPLSSNYMQFTYGALFLPKLIFDICYMHFFGLEPKYFPISSFPNIWPERIVIISTMLFLFLLISGYFQKRIRISKRIKSAFLILPIFLFFLSHELILLGIPYELWLPYPIFICLLFFLAEISLKNLQFVKLIYVFIIVVILVFSFIGVYDLKAQLIRSQGNFIPLSKIQVYSWNPPGWISVVEQTENYLKTHLTPGEKFLALPYEPIYYWLLDRKSPVIETMFFDFVNIPLEQEKRIINDLEKEHINYIVISNRIHSPEAGLGIFGVTNCQLLSGYIESNFKPVITFGNWDGKAEWSVDHATRIYKRLDHSDG